MATIIINGTNAATTQYDEVRALVNKRTARLRSQIGWKMVAILDDAANNTNATFAGEGRTEVDVTEWNRMFVANVECLMTSGYYDPIAVGNLGTYGFQP